MKQIFCTAILIVLAWIIFAFSKQNLHGKPNGYQAQPGNLKVFSVLVEDPKEAALLQQQLKLDIIKIEGIRLYYYDENNTIGGNLKDMGYKQMRSEIQKDK